MGADIISLCANTTADVRPPVFLRLVYSTILLCRTKLCHYRYNNIDIVIIIIVINFPKTFAAKICHNGIRCRGGAHGKGVFRALIAHPLPRAYARAY